MLMWWFVGMRDLEDLRDMYRPEKIKVLLVGESLPKRNFFYCDRGSLLGKATMKAFEKAFQKEFKNYREFLEFFKKHGFFLEDLFHEMNKKIDEVTPAELKQATEKLASFIDTYKPKLVIATLCRICGCVKEATLIAKTDAVVICLPFPRGFNYRKYISKLAEALQALSKQTFTKLETCCSIQPKSRPREYCL